MQEERSIHCPGDPKIMVETSDEVCQEFGFSYKDVAMSPHDLEVIIAGVAPNNKGQNVLWYEIIHPSSKGRIACWGGAKNLIEAGFVFLRKSA